MYVGFVRPLRLLPYVGLYKWGCTAGNVKFLLIYHVLRESERERETRRRAEGGEE